MTRFVMDGESDEYIQRRAELLAAEIALKDQIEHVAELRRRLPRGKVVTDYVFREGPRDLGRNAPSDFSNVHLSDLFANGHDTLLVDHLMFAPNDDAPCPMCSMWADGYSAIASHIEQRASFVLVAKADIGKLRQFAQRRGWDHIRLLSSHDTTFNRDLDMEDATGAQGPGLSVFTRGADGAIYHRYTVGANLDETNNRGIDLYSPVWQLLDLLPQGRDDWYPDHQYMERGTKAASAV